MPLATRLSSKPAAPVEEEKVPELPAEEPQQASPKPAFRSPLKDALGSIVYSKMPEHERLRFEAALSVGARTAVHVGNALQYDEYETHIATQLEARENEEVRKFAEMEAQRKKRLMSQGSVIRRVNMACADETGAWRRNQGKTSMRMPVKLPELGKGPFANARQDLVGGPQLRHDLVGAAADDEDDWLAKHSSKVAPAATSSSRRGSTDRSSTRWVGANASQRGSVRMMAALSQPQPQPQPTRMAQQDASADPGGWMAKTRSFMQSVVGKLAGDGAAGPHPLHPPAGCSGSIFTRHSLGSFLSAPHSLEGAARAGDDESDGAANNAPASPFPDPRQVPATPEPWLKSKAAPQEDEGAPVVARTARSFTSMGAEGGWRQFLGRARARGTPAPGAADGAGNVKLPDIKLRTAVSVQVR